MSTVLTVTVILRSGFLLLRYIVVPSPSIVVVRNLVGLKLFLPIVVVHHVFVVGAGWAAMK
jgi:hypothetical protein